LIAEERQARCHISTPARIDLLPHAAEKEVGGNYPSHGILRPGGKSSQIWLTNMKTTIRKINEVGDQPLGFVSYLK
jgi:hypothetical protein